MELAEECNGVRFDLTAQLAIASNERRLFKALLQDLLRFY